MADNKTLWTKYGREYIWNPCLSTFVGGTFSCHIRSRHCSRCADYFNSDHIRRNLQCPLQFPCKGEDSWLFHGVCLWIHVKCRFRQTVTRLINHLHLPFSISHSLTFNCPGLQSPPPSMAFWRFSSPWQLGLSCSWKENDFEWPDGSSERLKKISKVPFHLYSFSSIITYLINNRFHRQGSNTPEFCSHLYLVGLSMRFSWERS